jgi:uncharacterized protein
MILCDTGPLFAAADRKDDDHQASVKLFNDMRVASRRLLIPPTVVAEVGYMLWRKIGPVAEAAFLQTFGNGDLELVALEVEDLRRMAELVEKYADLPLGTTDASVIAVAERLGIREIATLDHRHFTVVRPHHVDSLILLP